MLPDVLDPPDPDSARGRDLIARARQIRHDAGVGFAAMARELGIAKSTLQLWETSPPTVGRHRSAGLFVGILAALDGWTAWPPGEHGE